MSEVYITFGTLLSLGIVFPGMLMTWWLLFPKLVGKAERRMSESPLRSLIFGALMTSILAIPILGLLSVSVPFATILGVGLIILFLGVATIGAAGMAHWMAGRLKSHSKNDLSESAAFLRAAVILELGAAFPFIGWFLFIPLSIMASLGAALWALFGRDPKPAESAPAINIVTTYSGPGATDAA